MSPLGNDVIILPLHGLTPILASIVVESSRQCAQVIAARLAKTVTQQHWSVSKRNEITDVCQSVEFERKSK